MTDHKESKDLSEEQLDTRLKARRVAFASAKQEQVFAFFDQGALDRKQKAELLADVEVRLSLFMTGPDSVTALHRPSIRSR